MYLLLVFLSFLIVYLYHYSFYCDILHLYNIVIATEVQ